MRNRLWRVLAPKSAYGRVLDRSWARLVAHKRLTWPQLEPQDGAKINKHRWTMASKINQISSASWNRYFHKFWLIFNGKMRPRWHQNRTQDRYCSETEKNKNSPLTPISLRPMQVGSKKRWKIDQKTSSTYEAIWAPILHRFWRI